MTDEVQETEAEHRQRVLDTLAENGIEVMDTGPSTPEPIVLGDDLADLAAAAGPGAAELLTGLASMFDARVVPLHRFSAERAAMERLSVELRLAAAAVPATA